MYQSGIHHAKTHSWDTPAFGYVDHGGLGAIGIELGYGAEPNFRDQSGIDGRPFVAAPIRLNCWHRIVATPHGGGIMVGLGDGSVKSVRTTVSLATWVQACHPDDGNALGSDW